MKKIEFIAPVDSMRGNLSGAQTLVYPTADNKAFDAPSGKNYARNYQTRYIGNKRSSDGLKYFGVKQRTATTITAASKRAMALLGATGAIVGAIFAAKDDTGALGELYAKLFAQYTEKHALVPSIGSFRKNLSDAVRFGLERKMPIIYYNGPRAAVGFYNPWIHYADDPETDTWVPKINANVLHQFWSILGPTGAVAANFIMPDGSKATLYAVSGKTFAELSASDSLMNTLYNRDNTAAGIMASSQTGFARVTVLPNLNPNAWIYAAASASGKPVAVQATDALDASKYYTISETEPA